MIGESDFILIDSGSITLFYPNTKEAQDWLDETAPEDAQFLGKSMAVESRFVEDVVNIAQEAGLSFSL